MAVKEIMPQQAHEILTGDPSAVYIDVRTEREFVNGHPPGAVNVASAGGAHTLEGHPVDVAARGGSLSTAIRRAR